MRRASPVEVLQKVEKETEMISEGRLEAVTAAWQEKAGTQESQPNGISGYDWLLKGSWQVEKG